jgi:iron-sulfur cluster assembly protein
MLTLTAAAAAQIRAASDHSDAVGMALRVAARRVADGSIEYGMGFDEAVDDDHRHPFDGVTVVVAPSSQPLLQDTVLDWVELEPGDFRFIFVPPQGACTSESAATGSGCGSGACGGCGPRD